MALDKMIKLSESEKSEVDEGSHLAVLQSIIHVGMQRSEYDGVVSYKDTVLLGFEIQDVESSDGRPITRTKRATTKVRSEKSTLVKLAVAMLGKAAIKEGIPFSELVGKPVMANFKTTKTGSTSIDSFSAVPKGLLSSVKPLINEPKLLLDANQIGKVELEKLPEFIKKMINERMSDTPASSQDADY